MTNNPSSNTFSSLDVEEFSLYDGREATRHFRRDHDLLAKARRDLFGSGDRRAVVLLQLGIDGNDCDEVVVDFYASKYGGEGAWGVVEEAIGTLEIIRDQLEVMRSAPEVRSAERNAYELGVEAQRAGLVEAETRDDK